VIQLCEKDLQGACIFLIIYSNETNLYIILHLVARASYIFLVNNQLDALILINYLFTYFLLSTCFEQIIVHHQVVISVQAAYSISPYIL
jgi:hypothetical protein